MSQYDISTKNQDTQQVFSKKKKKTKLGAGSSAIREMQKDQKVDCIRLLQHFRDHCINQRDIKEVLYN